MELTDRKYVEQCLDSHPEAYRHLVGRYEGLSGRSWRAGWGTGSRAQGAAQETLVRAYFQLGKLKKQDAFLSWLLGIGSRVAHEQIRTEARQRELARAHLERQNPQPEPGPDLALEQRVSEPPEPYREIVLLRYYGSLTCAQVAEQLGMPLGTVTKYSPGPTRSCGNRCGGKWMRRCGHEMRRMPGTAD